MTELQSISHQEQMDALRRDFVAFWELKREALRQQGFTRTEILPKQIEAWKECVKIRRVKNS